MPANLQALPAATVTDNFGGFGAYQNDFPSAGINFTLGQDTSPAINHTNIFEVQENFSLTHNRHSLKMGVDFVHTQSNIINVPSNLGHYFFGQFNLAGGFKSFIGEPTSGATNAVAVVQALPNVISNSTGAVTGQGSSELPLRESDIAGFIQDDFHVRSNVNLSFGLRYERFGQPINGILNMNPAGGTILPTSGGDFGPRVGVAWSPGANRKTVFRGGYALMYDQMPLNIPLLMWQSAPISPLISTITPAGGAPVRLERPRAARPRRLSQFAFHVAVTQCESCWLQRCVQPLRHRLGSPAQLRRYRTRYLPISSIRMSRLGPQASSGRFRPT